MRARKWITLESAKLCVTPIFSLHRYRRANPSAAARNFYVLEAPDWVNIVPLTADGDVVMVRQFRHGIKGFTLEIPGGMVDPEDKSRRAAARREMVEETGYDSADIQRLGKVHPNPAIQGNYCHSFLARNVKPIARRAIDHAEQTAVVKVPLSRVASLIASGKITHALVIAAFSFLQIYNRPRGRI